MIAPGRGARREGAGRGARDDPGRARRAGRDDHAEPPRAGQRVQLDDGRSVITSYSIHYTKLYEVMIEKAVCVIYPTAGNKVTGVVTFTKVEGGIKIVADLQGLTPGKHGFHIHEFGDCTSADGTSAGGHFNPSGVSHGGLV